jgi:hypothetical protein
MMHFPVDGQVGRFTKDTRIRYQFARRTRDPVLLEINATLRKLKDQQFAIFAPDFKFLAADDAPALWPLDNNPFGVSAYRVKVRKEILLETTVTVTLFPIGPPPSCDTIHINNAEEKKWVALEVWLHNTGRKCGSFLGHRLQSQWWKYTGKTFPFFDLPGELRDNVYMYVLGGEIYPMSSIHPDDYSSLAMCQKARVTLGLGHNRKHP